MITFLHKRFLMKLKKKIFISTIPNIESSILNFNILKQKVSVQIKV